MKHYRRSTDAPDPRNPGRNPHTPGSVPHDAWQAGYDSMPCDCPPGRLYESWYRQGAAAASYDRPSLSAQLAAWFWQRFIQPKEKM